MHGNYKIKIEESYIKKWRKKEISSKYSSEYFRGLRFPPPPGYGSASDTDQGYPFSYQKGGGEEGRASVVTVSTLLVHHATQVRIQDFLKGGGGGDGQGGPLRGGGE